MSSKSTENKSEISPYQKELIDTLKQINGYKIACEANVCALLYKNPKLLLDTTLDLNSFSNNVWKVYFAIINDIIKVEQKATVDQIIIGLYLEKHPKLKAKYEEYGGYNTISNAGTYVKEESFEGYCKELGKWNAVMKMAQKGWINSAQMPSYIDMTAEEIYQEHEAYLNDIFINVDNDVKSYDISYGIYDLIDDLDKGLAVGLPYKNMPILTNETGGQYFGSITLVGGLSNVGKSTFSRTATLMSIIENNEKIVVMLNEEDLKKWQREFLCTVVNTILKGDVQKHIIRKGQYSEETRELLKKAANWIVEHTQNHTITIIPFQSYQTSKVLKIIRKFNSMGVKYYLLDTFKLDAGKVNDNSWIEMQQNMVSINDVVKAEALNVHILITFQLAKGQTTRQRWYAQDNVGLAKNIIDPASTVIMIRNMFDDEYTGEKRELKVYRLEGKNGSTKIPVKLDKEKHYQIVFIIKNREGSANQFQIVIEHDMSRNLMKEIGICSVPVDF